MEKRVQAPEARGLFGFEEPRDGESHLQQSCSLRRMISLLNSFKQHIDACSFLSTHFFVRSIALIAIVVVYLLSIYTVVSSEI